MLDRGLKSVKLTLPNEKRKPEKEEKVMTTLISKESVTAVSENLAKWLEKHNPQFRIKLETQIAPADGKFQIHLDFMDPVHTDFLEKMKKDVLKRVRAGEDLNDIPAKAAKQSPKDEKGSMIVEKIRAALMEYEVKASAKVVQSILDGEPMPYVLKKALEEVIDDEELVAECKRKKVSLLFALLVMTGFTCKNKEVNAELMIAGRRVPQLSEIRDNPETPDAEEEEEEEEDDVVDPKTPIDPDEEEEEESESGLDEEEEIDGVDDDMEDEEEDEEDEEEDEEDEDDDD